MQWLRKAFRWLEEALDRIATKYVLLLLLSGALLMVVSGYVPQGHTRFRSGLDAVGLSIIITTLVTSLLNLRFENQIYRSFAIIQGCQGAGIYRIFENREDALEEINKGVGAALNQVDILAIAGREFLFPKCEVLKQIERWLISGARPRIRILLLDPRSRYAVERSLVEEDVDLTSLENSRFLYRAGALCEDIVLSLKNLESMLRLAKARKIHDSAIEVRTYNASPFLMYVRSDDRVFIEQYHCGITADDAGTHMRKFLGGNVPIIETSVASKTGQALGSHFEYLWARSRIRRFKAGCLEVLRQSLETDNWVERLREELAREDEEFVKSTLERSEPETKPQSSPAQTDNRLPNEQGVPSLPGGPPSTSITQRHSFPTLPDNKQE